MLAVNSHVIKTCVLRTGILYGVGDKVGCVPCTVVDLECLAAYVMSLFTTHSLYSTWHSTLDKMRPCLDSSSMSLYR